MALTNIERETIINFNDAEKTASVYTSNAAMIRRLNALCLVNAGVHAVRADEYGTEYECPKVWIKIRPSRIISDAKRAEMASAARARFHRTERI